MYQLKLLAYLPWIAIFYLLLAVFTCIDFHPAWFIIAFIFDMFDYMNIKHPVIAHIPLPIIFYIALVIATCHNFNIFWFSLTVLFEVFDYLD